MNAPQTFLMLFSFRDDPLLCISDDLICDGIRNCPIGGGMFSDEDEFLCKKHRFDNRDLTNVSFMLISLKSQADDDVSLLLDFREIFDLAAFDFGNFPKHFRSNWVNVSNFVNESNSRSSWYGSSSNAHNKSVQQSQEGKSWRARFEHKPSSTKYETSRQSWAKVCQNSATRPAEQHFISLRLVGIHDAWNADVLRSSSYVRDLGMHSTSSKERRAGDVQQQPFGEYVSRDRWRHQLPSIRSTSSLLFSLSIC